MQREWVSKVPQVILLYWMIKIAATTPGESGGMLAVIAALYLWTSVPRTLLFWAAFILTRPLGAVLGDFLDKPLAIGGMELGR